MYTVHLHVVWRRAESATRRRSVGSAASEHWSCSLRAARTLCTFSCLYLQEQVVMEQWDGTLEALSSSMTRVPTPTSTSMRPDHLTSPHAAICSQVSEQCAHSLTPCAALTHWGGGMIMLINRALSSEENQWGGGEVAITSRQLENDCIVA